MRTGACGSSRSPGHSPPAIGNGELWVNCCMREFIFHPSMTLGCISAAVPYCRNAESRSDDAGTLHCQAPNRHHAGGTSTSTATSCALL